MKLLIDILAGVAACGIAYYLALPELTENEARPVASHKPDVSDEGPPASRVPPVDRATVVSLPAGADESIDAGLSFEQQHSMNMLRNEMINKTAEDMQRRGENVMRCLDGVHLAGAEKIRFSVDVVSTPVEATTGRWRFVEIADGEPLPDSFASCAEHAFGSGLHLVPPKDIQFPQFRGDLPILYRIPAPSGN